VSTLTAGLIVDRYEVQSLIGAGAMGEVFLAVDRELGRKVALKILSDVHRDNRELRQRFIREARAVAAISHPNVVQVFTTGEFDGRPYFAMEYLAGHDLGTVVREQGPLSSRAAASSILDAARGLEAAAQAGLIHRDVKPSNLVRLDSGPVKVTDFGLVKPMMPDGDPALTALGVVVGTPDYIAPEQARGEEIDYRVDVYALGCTAYYLLVGKPPFRRGSDDEDKYLKVVARHLREAAPDPRKQGKNVDGELAELALAMMRKTAAERPTYAELIEQLEQIRARLVAASPSTALRAPTATGSRRAQPQPEPPPAAVSDPPVVPVQGRSTWLWVVTLLSAATFVVGAGLTVLRRLRQEPGPVVAVQPGAADAAAPAVVRPPDANPADAGPPAPTAPEGMILVRRFDGSAAFFCDRNPVSNREYAEKVRSHHYPAAEANRPVTGISYENAKNFAKLSGKRLLRDGEWTLALDTLGFVPAGMRLWEWVDDGRESDRERAVRRVNEGKDKRKASGDKTITFRLAQDLPG
jgi:eukaryotic-like serine/threonine-protein kinase